MSMPTEGNWYELLSARMQALENLVDQLRDELYAMRDDVRLRWDALDDEVTDAEIEDMAAYIDELDPDGWIGGTESEGE